jgi:hypothetical protein
MFQDEEHSFNWKKCQIRVYDRLLILKEMVIGEGMASLRERRDKKSRERTSPFLFLLLFLSHNPPSPLLLLFLFFVLVLLSSFPTFF